jgi:uncharacterized membrane protein YqjE
MIGETTRFRGSAEQGGLFGSMLGFGAAFTEFIEARLALVAAESKTALVQLLTLVICLMAAVMFFAIAYLFLIVTAVVWLARAIGLDWWWIALIAAGLHFMVALILLLVAKMRTTKPLFPETSSELEKDRQWLRSLDARSRPLN